MKKHAFRLLRLLFLLVGVVILVGIVRKIGLHAIEWQMERLGWHLIPILSIGFFWYLCYALAWDQCVRQQNAHVPLWALYRSKVCGDAVNVMTPANFLGGDPMRVYLLRGTADVTTLGASVVVDRTINSIAIVFVISIGALTAFLTMPQMPERIKIGAPLFLIVTSGMIFYFFLKQKKGLFGAIFRLGKKLHIATHWIDKHYAKVQELDEKVLLSYQKGHARFWLAFFFHILGRLLGILEVYLIGITITSQFTLQIALLLATMAPIINALFTFIPGALGIMEGAYSGALYLLGLDPALGLTIQMVKRIRAGLWMFLSLAFIYSFRSDQKDGDSKDPLPPPLQTSR